MSEWAPSDVNKHLYQSYECLKLLEKSSIERIMIFVKKESQNKHNAELQLTDTGTQVTGEFTIQYQGPYFPT